MPPVVVDRPAPAGDGPRVNVPATDEPAVIELPLGELAVRTPGPGRAPVGLRRWGAVYVATNGLDLKVCCVLRVGPDRERTPVQVSVGGPAEVRVCSLRA